MGTRGFRAAAIGCALTLAISLSVATPAIAAPTAYPTWEEIEAARGNEAATAATIATIDSLLDQLQAEAARLGDEAVAREAAATTALAARDRAATLANSLAQQSKDAADRADLSRRQAGQIAAALYRSGGADLTGSLFLLEEDSSDSLLYRLGALSKLGGQLDEAMTAAESDRNASVALRDQAQVAATERDRLSTEAQNASTTARAAAVAADAAVALQQQSLTLLYQQLASLKNTTVALEQQYRIGQSAGGGPGGGGSSGGGSSGGGSGGGGSTGGGDGGGGFVVPGNEVNNARAAQDFARAQLAAMGHGSDQFSCLVQLWNRESGWRTNAYNASSGAYGIPQSLPGSKMGNYAADWRTNYQTQVMWGLLYISGRYSTPCGAWAHSEDVGWY